MCQHIDHVQYSIKHFFSGVHACVNGADALINWINVRMIDIHVMYTPIYIYRCEFKYNAIYLNNFLCHKCTSKYTYIIHLKITWAGAFSSVHHYYKYIFNNSEKNMYSW